MELVFGVVILRMKCMRVDIKSSAIVTCAMFSPMKLCCNRIELYYNIFTRCRCH
jgi:hypothetical protein